MQDTTEQLSPMLSSKDHRMALPPGTRIESFTFDRVLGHGGFGITYLGWNVSLDMPVAIKEYLPAQWAVREQNRSIAPKSTTDKEFFDWGLERFLYEARMMARFKHPNIVQVQHFFQAHGTAYIVMEYVEGETLEDSLKRCGTLTEQELKAILLPLLAGLMEVHEAGVLHRDIKPANILLRAADGSPVLADFGAAREDAGARSRLTEIRTRYYAPPEQYSEKGHQGPWTDIYALGAVCYQALLGKVPAEAITRLTPPDPLIPAIEAGKGKAGAAFLAAMDWALRVQGPDRPQEISVWREALLGKKTVPQRDQPPTDGGSGKSRVSGWLMTLEALLLIGAGAWWGWQQFPQWFGQGDDVARLLAAADANLRARRLTSPAGNNAWDMYRKVLNLQPGNPQAIAGMEQVITSYMELFDEAMGQQEFDKASGYLNRINELHPDSPMLEQGQQRLEAARQAQVQAEEAARQAEQERQQREQEAARIAEQQRQQREQEAARIAEQQRQQQEQEAARIAEQERQQQEQEAARIAEQQRQQQAQEAARIAEQQRQQQEQEAARIAEQERQQQAQEAARIAEQQRQQQEQEAARQVEQEQRQQAQLEKELANCKFNSGEFFQRTTAREVVNCIRHGRGDVSSRDAEEMTPLHLAAIFKPSEGIIAALLEAGADVNSRNKFGQTPLHYIVWRSSKPDIVAALTKAGADANIRSHDEDGALAPLHIAARFSSTPGIITALIKAGADVNIRNRHDRTPLYFAARYSSEPGIMAALLAAGADPKLADRGGKTPWDYIQDNPNLKNTDAYRQLEALSR